MIQADAVPRSEMRKGKLDKKCVFMAIALILLQQSRAFAQNTLADCAIPLRYAGENWNTETDQSKSNSAVNWYCSHEFDSEQQAVAAAASVSIPIDFIPVGGSGSGSSTSYRQQQLDFCASSSRYSDTVTKFVASKSTDNPVIASGVSNCLGLMAQQTGLMVWLEQSPDVPDAFKVKVSLKGALTPAKITSFATSIPAVTESCFPSLKGFVHLTSETLCHRDPKEAVMVSLNVKNYTPNFIGNMTLPGALPPPVNYYLIDIAPKIETSGRLLEHVRCEALDPNPAQLTCSYPAIALQGGETTIDWNFQAKKIGLGVTIADFTQGTLWPGVTRTKTENGVTITACPGASSSTTTCTITLDSVTP